MPFVKNNHILIAIFVFALLIRFLYFPGNTQFAYDQARDAYASQSIFQGDLRLIGPSTTISPYLHHGVLFYYMAAPIYFIANNNPEALSLVLRIINASGVFLIFYLASTLFNRKAGLIAALLYAISFEQTQYSLFLSHPAPAVISVSLFYFGLAQYYIKKNPNGIIWAAIGIGTAFQFHASLFFLLPVPLVLFLIFHKKEYVPPIKQLLIAGVCFSIFLSTFLIDFIKNNFLIFTSKSVSIYQGEMPTLFDRITGIDFTINRYINHNLFFEPIQYISLIIIPLLFFLAIYYAKEHRKSILLLLVWFLWGLIPYLVKSSVIYFYSIGTSISLILLASILISKIPRKFISVQVICIIIVLISNFYLILKYNPQGPIRDITSQDGMLLSDQKKVVDYTYQQANYQPFAINGLTVPFHVNTTWSYIYNFYGKQKYGYLPVWGGENALGFATSLETNTNRSSLPQNRFLIIEQTQGLKKEDIDKFIDEEYIFSNKVDQKQFGLLTVQKQSAK